MTVPIDMTGVRYGKLVGIEYVFTDRRAPYWYFRCDCGEKTLARGAAVRKGSIRSCGCARRECGRRNISNARRFLPDAFKSPRERVSA